MISRLTGKLLEKSPLHIVVDCHGLGYALAVPMSTFEKLPITGQMIHLFVEHVIKDNVQLLFGFLDPDERDIFRELLKINTVGPKLALAILSTFNLSEFHKVVTEQDILRLTKVPKIGKKTAERLLIEFKNRFKINNYDTHHQKNNNNNLERHENNDVINALLTLGYSLKEAQKACNKIELSQDLSENIRLALQYLSCT